MIVEFQTHVYVCFEDLTFGCPLVRLIVGQFVGGFQVVVGFLVINDRKEVSMRAL